MKRRHTPGRTALLMIVALLLGALLAPAVARGQDGGLDERTREVAKRLNCPTCAGRNLADCPTDTCAQWKAEITAQLKAGKSEAEVTDYFISRFGAGVLQEPPRQGGYLLAWAFPVILFIALCVAAFAVARRALRKEPAPDVPAAGSDPYLDALERDVQEG